MKQALEKQKTIQISAQASSAGMVIVATPECTRCRSMEGQWRGYVERQQDHVIFHRRWCKDCGKWFYGAQLKQYRKITRQKEREQLLNEELAHESWIEAYQEAKRGEAK